ncbi:MAG: glutathione S-transferase family protein [Thiogranum sp.]|jgi:glutathione S-transferase|nr:glutathione S-transferase family protein [Thiogranum sp.]
MLGDHLQDKMKIYGNPACLNTAKCLFTAAEKGIDVESHFVGPDGAGEAAAAAAISPHGSLPVLRDVDFVVYGTNAIMSYLDDKGFGPSLVPRNAVVRTVMYQWIHIASELAQPAVASLMSGEGDTAVTSHWFDVLDAQLKSKPATLRGEYICGVFSLADIHWAALAQGCFLCNAGDIIESRPAVKAWWGLIKAHPSTSKEKIKAYDVLPTSNDINGNNLRDIHINA